MVAQTCNSSYSGGRDWEYHGSRQAKAKIYEESISTNQSWAWWYVPVIPATWEA
jgi:hypothetical protein